MRTVIVEGGRWEVGAAITFPVPGGGSIDMTLTGTVLAVDEAEGCSPIPGATTRVLRFELLAEGEGTRLGAH